MKPFRKDIEIKGLPKHSGPEKLGRIRHKTDFVPSATKDELVEQADRIMRNLGKPESDPLDAIFKRLAEESREKGGRTNA